MSGARGFLPFSGDFKTPPRPRPKGEARPRGWKRPSVGACGSPAVMTPRVLASGFTGAGKCLGLLQPLLRTTQCQLGGDLPLGEGHPDRGARGGFLGPIQATTVHPIVSAGAGTGASDLSSNPPFTARSLSLPLRGMDRRTVPTVQGNWQYSAKRLGQYKRRIKVSLILGPDPQSQEQPPRRCCRCGPNCFNSEIPALERPAKRDNPPRTPNHLIPEMPEPSFRRGRREVSGKAAPPLGARAGPL